MFEKTDNIIEIKGKKYKKVWNPKCKHKSKTYCLEDRVIRCADCGDQLSAFDSLVEALRDIETIRRDLKWEKKQLQEDKDHNFHLIAARKAEKAWRKRGMVPVCPHCAEAIFPKDGFGDRNINREYAEQKRKFKDKHI